MRKLLDMAPEKWALVWMFLAIIDGLTGDAMFAAVYGIFAVVYILIALNVSHRPDDGWFGIPSSEIKYRITHKRRYEEMLTRSRYYAAVGNDNMADFERHVARHYARLVRMEVFRLGRR